MPIQPQSNRPEGGTVGPAPSSMWEATYHPASDRFRLPGRPEQRLSADISINTTGEGLSIALTAILRQHSPNNSDAGFSVTAPSRISLPLEDAETRPVAPRGHPESSELRLTWQGIAEAILPLTDEQSFDLRGQTAAGRASQVKEMLAESALPKPSQVTFGQRTYDRCDQLLQEAHDEVRRTDNSEGTFGLHCGSRLPFSADDWQGIGLGGSRPDNTTPLLHKAACLRGIYVRSGLLAADQVLSPTQASKMEQDFWNIAKPTTRGSVPIHTRVTDGLAHSLANILSHKEAQTEVDFVVCQQLVNVALAGYRSSGHAELQSDEDLLSVVYQSIAANAYPEDEEIHSEDEEDPAVFVQIGNDTGLGGAEAPGRRSFWAR